MPAMSAQTYAQRAQKHANPAARQLLETIERKQTNLCVSVDVIKKADFLAIIDAVGPFVCLIKATGTHVDILEDFDETIIKDLQELSVKHDFLIFEDRKFADIGNTVSLQYSSGVHKIASWSHITNAHPVPGPSIITGLGVIGRPLGRGLLLLAEMSTKGSLATGAYTEEAVRMARAAPDFVVGFIAQRRMEGIGATGTESNVEEEDFLVLTPGVGLDVKGDTMGQQYRTPKQVVLESGCDVIIVGRGIYGKTPIDINYVHTQAERYRKEGWSAYQERLQLSSS
ncbi:Orotidine 5'-phosphate decarboxylase [Punctularia strigosozonata HHB-11173 SS5]|uniref:Orotidine 5'-phosphate decarboxylase n=1 Tax=Punctularia strigosozonata (strain HHB-11173) TaxID=741275 RepID=UPI0004418226|nr:Orotidine 5'-phosphate decarboxylase [Punctularia strigosozonata HHB-11173 SS5]EIN10416.1 Orotidine 5'-phosphate decarboxylase [Punctularia strigosozonata HHB-11173 SS5]